MDVALQNAIARREALRERIDNIDSEISSLRKARERATSDLDSTNAFVRMWYEMAGVPDPATEQIEIDDVPPPPVRRPKNPDREFVAKVCLEIISAAGQPLGRKTLFDALAERGIHIHGKDPEMVLSTMLWRSQDKIVRLPQHGYWPKDEANPDANYWPEFEDLMGATANEPEDGIEADDAD